MSTLFISDLHLSENQPDLTRLFFHFLQHKAKNAEALYILGDFFEVWVGDDEQSPFQKKIIKALADLTASGVTTYFMVGNRDFLIGERFIKESGCKLLPDPTRITRYGIPILLMHGDSLCTSDKYYVSFRYLTRLPFLQACFLKLPLRVRKKIARYLRGNPSPMSSNEAKFDVVMDTLFNYLQCYPAQLIIHGHTHKPCIQLFQHNKRLSKQNSSGHLQKSETLALANEATPLIKRIVLSDWNSDHGNVLILSPNGECELIYFS